MPRFVEIVFGIIDAVGLIGDRLGEGRKIKVLSSEGKITDRHASENPAKKFSETSISISIHNSSRKDINVGRILVEYSKASKLYPIYDYEAEKDIRKYISPLKGFLLPAGKTSQLKLNYINNFYDGAAGSVDCILKIYTNDYRVMKKVRMGINTGT